MLVICIFESYWESIYTLSGYFTNLQIFNSKTTTFRVYYDLWKFEDQIIILAVETKLIGTDQLVSGVLYV